ncbi:MAG: hypothetical protein HOM89_04870, partial [Ilumatobacter sp.]|nr:hypothetical protein [Ilumatobacter sp.]
MSRFASIPSSLRRSAIAQRIKSGALESWRANVIATSRYFDSAWYLQANDDVRRTGVDPLVHFLLHGEEEGRDPGPDFDTAAYVLLNPDAQGAALTHFHRIVAAADSPAPDITVHTIVARDLRAIKTQWFDESWYRATHDTSATFACVHPL